MKLVTMSLIGLTMISATALIGAQSADVDGSGDATALQRASVPFKAHVSGELAVALSHARGGSAEFVLSIFDSATGGTKLFEETQSIRASGNNLYAEIGSATSGGVPAHVLSAHPDLWLEISEASAPAIALQGRQKVSFRRPNAAGMAPNAIYISVDPSMCFTCGGAFPYLVGSWSTPTPGAYERGGACGGSFTYSTDTRPYLCSR